MFKKRKRRNLRKKSYDEEESTDGSFTDGTQNKLNQIVEEQKDRKLRRYNRGLDAKALGNNNSNIDSEDKKHQHPTIARQTLGLASLPQTKFISGSISSNDTAGEDAVADKKFMEYYESTLLKSGNVHDDDPTAKSSKAKLNDTTHMIDATMAIAEVELPQKYSVQNVKNIMSALKEEGRCTGKKAQYNKLNRNKNFFRQDRAIVDERCRDSSHNQTNKNSSTDMSVLRSFKEFDAKTKRNR